jgi:gamma-glutamylcyclotransferase (GGCT)/AIG2-like uncharacterized protein YtfP
VAELIFFYGTLMTGFDRRRRIGIDSKLRSLGRGEIRATLFDLGIFPAAVPALDDSVRGEVYEVQEEDAAAVLAALDEIEGFRPSDPDHSLYRRAQTDVRLEDGRMARTWVYFYNAPLGGAQRIPSGDYLEHMKVR